MYLFYFYIFHLFVLGVITMIFWITYPIVTEEMNEQIQKVPTIEEVREAVMGLNKDSTAGPNGMTGSFFQEI